MTARVVMESEFAAHKGRVRFGKRVGSKVFLPKESIHRSRSDFSKELAFRIRPLIRSAASDENGTRRVERDQHVRVNRHVVPTANVFLQVAGELPCKILCHIIYGLAPVAAGQGGTQFTGTSGEHGRNASVFGAGPQDGLAEA